MPTKTVALQSGVLAIFVGIPLFRPILVAHELIYLIYAIFVLGFVVCLANIGFIKECYPRQAVLLLVYVGASVLASLFATQDVRLDYLGLLCFLPISYFLGTWLAREGSTPLFFGTAALLFVSIACYIIYQLSNSSFSYGTYYYWSSAAYKIDYLTSSLYAGVLAIYYGFNGRTLLGKYWFPLLCFGFIAISGARYSIMFSAIAGIYMLAHAARKAPVHMLAGVGGMAMLLLVLGLLNQEMIAKVPDLISYSVLRLESLVGEDHSVDGRMVLMQKATEIVSEHVSFGVGLGGSGDALDGEYPHNMLIEAFVDGGVFSVLPLSLFVLYSVYGLIKSRHQHKAWCLLLVLYLLGAFLKSFSIYESRMLFFFLGFAATLSMRGDPASSELEGPSLNLSNSRLSPFDDGRVKVG